MKKLKRVIFLAICALTLGFMCVSTGFSQAVTPAVKPFQKPQDMTPDVTALYVDVAMSAPFHTLKHSEINLAHQTVTTRVVASDDQIPTADFVNIPQMSVVAYRHRTISPFLVERVTVSFVPIGGGAIRSSDMPIGYTTSSGMYDWYTWGISVQADSQDKIYVFVSGNRPSIGAFEFYVFTSDDYGNSWTRNLLLSSTPPNIWIGTALEARVDEVNNQYHLATHGSLGGVTGVVSLVFNSNTGDLLSSGTAFSNMGVCNNYLNFEANAVRSYVGVPVLALGACQKMSASTRTGIGGWNTPTLIPYQIIYSDEVVLTPNPMNIFAATLEQPVSLVEGQKLVLRFSPDHGASFSSLGIIANDFTKTYSYPDIVEVSPGVLAVAYVENGTQIKMRHSGSGPNWIETHVGSLPVSVLFSGWSVGLKLQPIK